MSIKRITALEGYDRFKTECSFFLLENEYPGWTGEEKFGVITSLTEAELLARYPAIMEALSPYILLGKDYAEVRKESRYNDDKFRYRRNNCDIPFDVDDDAACHHDELTEDDFTSRLSDKEDLEKALVCLTAVQRSRVLKFYYVGLTLKEIGESEGGVNPKSVWESIQGAIKKMKKHLS